MERVYDWLNKIMRTGRRATAINDHLKATDTEGSHIWFHTVRLVHDHVWSPPWFQLGLALFILYILLIWTKFFLLLGLQLISILMTHRHMSMAQLNICYILNAENASDIV